MSSATGPAAASPVELALGDASEGVERRLRRWQEEGFGRRLWARDFRLWADRPVPELADRLGWLDLPERMGSELESFRQVAAGVREARFERVILLGMGGSSLAPELFQRVFGNASGHPELTVLDSTHPAAVAELAGELDPAATLFVVSSKSGTTIETLSFERFFRHWLAEAGRSPGGQFVAVTDPGSQLSELAAECGFRARFHAPPDVGGRYSALGPFGLAPAALLGADVERLVASARSAAEACGPEAPAEESPGLRLGAALGELALAGRDQLTLLTTPRLASLPDWIEQLVAESTGKGGEGILPVVGEPPLEPAGYRPARFFVGISLEGDGHEELEARLRALASAGHPVAHLRLRDPYDLGAQLFLWEVAVAAAGAVLRIQPFDQPDVELAKRMAREAMAGDAAGGPLPEVSVDAEADLGRALGDWLAGEPRYVSTLAFLAPGPAVGERLSALQHRLLETAGAASTVGYGPRYLHSTGQLHKGGPEGGRFLELVDRSAVEVPVPESGYGFGELIAAQAIGDARALLSRDRRLLRVDLGADAEAGLDRLLKAIGG